MESSCRRGDGEGARARQAPDRGLGGPGSLFRARRRARARRCGCPPRSSCGRSLWPGRARHSGRREHHARPAGIADRPAGPASANPGGWTAGRPVPLQVWGPSGQTPEMGTKYAIEHFLKAFNWDYQTRAFKINPTPGEIKVHEFDYKAVNKVIYDENGIKIRSIPAIHAGDGPVSYIIEYEGMKLVFGGDSAPNKWFVKYAKNADFAIHEAFGTPEYFVKEYNQPPQLAWRACCAFHTSGPAFGKIMSEVNPRHAVAYHSMEEAIPDIQSGIRETYDGPLSMAVDNMVWNITKEKVVERKVVSTDLATGVPGPTRQPPPVRGKPDPMSDFIKQGEWGPGFNAQNRMLDEHSEKFKLEKMDWRKQRPWYESNKMKQ